MIVGVYETLLALYPARVRSEFGGEMRRVFLEARDEARSRGRWAYARFCFREVFGMMGGLMGAGGVFRYRRWIAACALLGAGTAGLLIWEESRQDYVSRAVLRVVAPRIPETIVGTEPIRPADLEAMKEDVQSRVGLVNLINTRGLYEVERRRMPMEDVVELARKALQIQTMREGNAFEVAFAYRDNGLAQKVTQDVVSQFIDSSVRHRSSQVMQAEQFLEDMTAEAGREMDKANQALTQAERSQGGALARLQLEAAQARRHYESLRDKLALAHMRRRLEERKQGATLQVLDPASLPQERLATEYAPWSILIGAAVGALGGLLAGLVTAWLYGWWPRSTNPLRQGN